VELDIDVPDAAAREFMAVDERQRLGGRDYLGGRQVA